jgi:putative ABC transport system permease protein
MELYKLKITVRNARKNGILSFAKLFGLSISFAVILFAVGYVFYETSFDKNIPDHDRIYRCLMQGKLENQDADFAVTSPEMASAITADIPEITEALRILNRGTATLKYNDLNFDGGQLFYADANFFSFFSISLNTSLSEPLAANNAVIIAESIAAKIFGSAEKALGKTINLNREDAVITGFFKDLPPNFHLQAKLIQPLQKSKPDEVGWGSQNYYTYFKTVRPNIPVEELNFKLSKTVYTYYDDRIDGAAAQTLEDLKYTDELFVLFTCEPLTDIHFSNHKFDPAITSSKTYVYGAVILAVLILLISSVNFINLTLANISTRLKEVGIRKTNGAHNYQIFVQFLYETAVFLVAGFILALAVYLLIQNRLEQYLGFDILNSGKQMIKIFAGVFGGLLAFNLLINFLPIAFISQKKIFSLIKDEKPVRKRFSGINGFVFLQFVLSGLIILGSLIVQKQINYLVEKDRGYDSENVLMLTMWQMNPNTRKNFIEDLKSSSAVKSISTSDIYFGEDPSMNAAYFETREDENFFHTSVFPVDDAFLTTFGLEMKEGRFFEKERESDFKAVVLNEAALKKYTGKESLIGKEVIVDGNYKVIGIVKDFNFRSLHHSIQPLVMTRVENFGNVHVKISKNRTAEVVEIAESLWKKHHIEIPFRYTFHDDVFARHYIKDQQAKKLLLILSIISITIACVGLYLCGIIRDQLFHNCSENQRNWYS